MVRNWESALWKVGQAFVTEIAGIALLAGEGFASVRLARDELGENKKSQSRFMPCLGLDLALRDG
jgi:hypothetical protein